MADEAKAMAAANQAMDSATAAADQRRFGAGVSVRGRRRFNS